MKTTTWAARIGLAIMFLTGGLAQAVNYSWNVTDGDFDDAGNWTPAGGPPAGTGDNAYFNRGDTTYEVNLKNGPHTVNQTFIGNSVTAPQSQNLTLTGGTLTADSHHQIGTAGGDNTSLTIGAGTTLDTIKWDVNVANANGSENNTVTVSNGGKLSANRNFLLGSGTATNNLVLVTGDGSLLEAKETTANVGHGMFINGRGNTLRIADQGAAAVGHRINVDGTGNRLEIDDGSVTGWQLRVLGTNNTLTVANGGTMATTSDTFIGTGAGISGATIEVSGGGSVTGGGIFIGQNGAGGTTATVSGTGSKIQSSLYDVNVGPGTTTNTTVTVENGGTLGSARVFFVGGTGSNNTVTVTTGGIMDSRRTGTDAGITFNGVNNTVAIANGGILQFAWATPAITGATPDNFSIADSTVSFKDITAADVRVSKGSAALNPTKVSWAGANTFRLNAAQNRVYEDQVYTFATGLGAENFARLELINGATWRGGAATIGDGGALVVGTGTNTVGVGVSFASGGTLAMTFSGPAQSSYLLASGAAGAVNLDNATLSLTLAAIPEENVPYPILGVTGGGTVTGRFQNNSLTAFYGGKELNMAVRYEANAVSIVYTPRGTMISIR